MSYLNEAGTNFPLARKNPIPLNCYHSVSGELVIELANKRFVKCRSTDVLDKKLDELFDIFAYHIATVEMKPFSFILYNKKHFFYRKGTYEDGHEIFERALKYNTALEKFRYLYKEISL